MNDGPRIPTYNSQRDKSLEDHTDKELVARANAQLRVLNTTISALYRRDIETVVDTRDLFTTGKKLSRINVELTFKRVL